MPYFWLAIFIATRNFSSSPTPLFFFFFLSFFNCKYTTEALEAFTKDASTNWWCLHRCGSLVLQKVAGLDHTGWHAIAQKFFTFLSRSRALSKVEMGCQWWVSCSLSWPDVLLSQTMLMKYCVLLHSTCHSKCLEDWKMIV